jgi:hypothetical protein
MNQKIAHFKIAKQKNGRGYFADILIQLIESDIDLDKNHFIHLPLPTTNAWMKSAGINNNETERMNHYFQIIEKGINLCCLHHSYSPCKIQILNFGWNPVDTQDSLVFMVSYKAMERLIDDNVVQPNAPYFDEDEMKVINM